MFLHSSCDGLFPWDKTRVLLIRLQESPTLAHFFLLFLFHNWYWLCSSLYTNSQISQAHSHITHPFGHVLDTKQPAFPLQAYGIGYCTLPLISPLRFCKNPLTALLLPHPFSHGLLLASWCQELLWLVLKDYSSLGMCSPYPSMSSLHSHWDVASWESWHQENQRPHVYVVSWLLRVGVVWCPLSN